MCTCSWGRTTHIAPNTRLSFSHFAFLIFLNHSQIHTKIRVQAAYFVQYLLTLVQSTNDCFTTIVKCSRDNAQQQIVSTKQNRCAPKKIIAFISSILSERKETTEGWRLAICIPHHTVFVSELTARCGPGPPDYWGFQITHNCTSQSVGLLWMRIGPSQRPLPDGTQHSQDRNLRPRRNSNPQSPQARRRRPSP